MVIILIDASRIAKAQDMAFLYHINILVTPVVMTLNRLKVYNLSIAQQEDDTR